MSVLTVSSLNKLPDNVVDNLPEFTVHICTGGGSTSFRDDRKF